MGKQCRYCGKTVRQKWLPHLCITTAAKRKAVDKKEKTSVCYVGTDNGSALGSGEKAMAMGPVRIEYAAASDCYLIVNKDGSLTKVPATRSADIWAPSGTSYTAVSHGDGSYGIAAYSPTKGAFDGWTGDEPEQPEQEKPHYGCSWSDLLDEMNKTESKDGR